MTSRTATILVTDLVGSTEHRVRLGEDAADEFRRRHDRILAEVVAQADGTVIKGLGDGILAMFQSATDALRAAVGIQHAIDGYCRQHSESHSVRVGISGGDVNVEDDDIFGIAVVEAARLCSTAEGGQILVADLVRLTTRNRGNHSFVRIGSLELKGLDEPVETHELCWTPLESVALVALPPALEGRHLFGFVGRHEQRQVLDAAWEHACDGHRRVVLLAGEAGIGKTRLATEVARAAHSDDSIVLFGGCEEALAAPYRPWIEALGHLVEHAPLEMLTAVDRGRLADVGRVIPRVGTRIKDLPAVTVSDPETERYLFYAGVVSLIEALTQRAPVLILLDDLHWADQPSLVLLQHVVRNTEHDRLLVIGTYRNTDVSGAHQFGDSLASLSRVVGVEHLDVAGLDEVELAGLVQMAVGSATGDHGAAMARALRKETSGNAFFASELLRHLGETGARYDESDGTWESRIEQFDQMSLPTSIRSLVKQRIARLGPSAESTLARASVVGLEFDFKLLSAISELGEDDLLDVLEQTEAAGLVESGAAGSFRFSHALVQHSLYSELSATRRAREHLAVAESMERFDLADIRPAESARHWAAANTETGIARAIHFSQLAGAHAGAGLAPQEAARHYTNALELLGGTNDEDPALRCELLLLLAQAQCQAGNPEFRDTVVVAAGIAEKHHDPDRLVRAALTDYQRGYMSLNDPDRVRILEAALEAIGSHNSPGRAKLLACLSLELSFSDIERSGIASAEARAIAERLGDPESLVKVWLHGGGGRFPDRAGLAQRRTGAIDTMELVRTLGDPVHIFGAAFANMQSATWFAELDRFDEHIGIMTELANDIARPDFQWIATYCRADQALLEGDDLRAETLVQEAYDIGKSTEQPGAFTIFAAGLQCVRWHQGRMSEVGPLLAEAAANDPNLTILGVSADDAASRTAPTVHDTNEDEVVRQIRLVPHDQSWLISITVLAEMAARQRNGAACTAAYEVIKPFDGLFAGSTAALRGSVAHYLGILAAALGDTDAAGAHFADATAINDRMQAPFHGARTQLEWGTLLAAKETPQAAASARELVEGAHVVAVDHHCAQVERRAVRLLEALRR